MADLTEALRSRPIRFVCEDRVADDHVIAGHTDLAIRPSPRSVYDRLRRHIDVDGQAMLLTSELRRCQQTGARLLPNRDFTTEDQVTARAFGEWEGRTWEQVREEDPVRCEAFWNDYARERPPNGESLRDVANRVDLFMTGLSNRDWEEALVVTHAEVIRVMACLILEMKLKNALKLSVEPLSVSTFSHSWMGWQVESFNVVP